MTSPRNSLPVAIAGGGIGGLACALALARHGFRSLVLEQAPVFGEVGVGLHVAPNALSPGKRPFHTIIPAMAFKGGKLWSSFGVMGGHIQPQGHVQVLLNAIDFGMDPQRALDAPRIVWYAGRMVDLERGISEDTRMLLQRMGHDVLPPGDSYGGGQMIVIDADSGALLGGSDPRKDGCAIGF